ncbi:MAG: TA system VapC family ribonuclease toxin [Myxococcota bacterium]
MKLLDVNVLIYAFQPVAPAHAAWRAWLDDARDRPFCVPDEVCLGFVRIVTNRKVFTEAATTSEALAFLDALRASAGWRELARTPGRWGTLGRVAAATHARAAAVSDAWLATLAIEADAELVSADRDFAAFPGLRWRCPVP